MQVREALDPVKHPWRRALVSIPIFAFVLAIVLSAFVGGSFGFWFPLKLVVYTPIILGLTAVGVASRRRRSRTATE